MLERRVDGLVLARPVFGPDMGPVLASLAKRLPLVVIAAQLHLPGVDTVEVDNRQGGLDATAFLIEQGHRVIATITGRSPGRTPAIGWPATGWRSVGPACARTPRCPAV